MTDKPLVTLLIPVYNSPDLFCALESVRKQTYRPLQFILINDCSLNFDEQRVRTYFAAPEKDFTFLLLQNEKNLGTVRSLNRGLALADGKYIFNLASDDAFFDENVLADWVAAFEQTDFDLLTARRAVYDRSLEKVLTVLPTEKAITRIKSASGQELFEYLAKENQVSGACTAWRAESLRGLGLFDEHYRLIEDYPAYLKLLREGGKIGFFDRIVVRYRSGGGSAEGQSVSEDFAHDFIEIFQREIIPYVKKPLLAKARIARWKKSVRFDRWYNREREKSANSKSKLCALRIMYGAYHPTRSARTILSSIQRLNKHKPKLED
ncbi:MAG: glycosyltransferase [Eubacteriales bacterium]|nr:glycosyltransferase [Eubacteriales bacterium]